MIPTVEDCRSAPMAWRFGEGFNPPGITNFLGCVQADLDLTAIRSLTFPPYGAGDTVTASLFLDGRYFPSTGETITFTWRPDRIVREAEWRGLRLRSTTVLARDAMAALVVLEIENRAAPRTVDLRLALRGGVTRSEDGWRSSATPVEVDHDVTVAPGAVTFRARGSEAACAQAASPEPLSTDPDAMRWSLRLEAGERTKIRFASAIAPRPDAARALASRLLRNVAAAVDEARALWDDELRAVFTPGNARYGGSMPVLETANDALARLYRTGVLGVALFRREGPLGRSYDTLMPRYWQTVTFLWDYSLSSVVHALLDPGVMREHLERWIATDVHTCFGTDRLMGGPVGGWYAVNDYAMTRMIHDYLRWSGDRAWLPSAAEHLRTYATSWRRFRTEGGLADYGGIGNLLECVSTYVHEVAALNASTVWNLRTAASVLEAAGRAGDTAPLRAEAEEVLAALRALYAKGEGWWHARHPGGRLVEVRHCYDLITVLDTIPGDLPAEQRDEMIAFFERELRTPSWLHALSAGDPDATYSVRPDHQWTGAYTAWPALALGVLWREGRGEMAAAWAEGLARSANQGPFGQAHFVETAAPPIEGGARKAPPDFPWICDWACSSNGAWASVVIESLFGVRAALDGITAEPRLGAIDRDARLRGLAYQGRLYDVDRDGIREARA